MTDAVVSQLVAETLRTNLAPDAQTSQLVAEVLRPNAGLAYTLTAASRAFTVTGVPIYRLLEPRAFTLTGQNATLTYTPRPPAGAICLLVGL